MTLPLHIWDLRNKNGLLDVDGPYWPSEAQKACTRLRGQIPIVPEFSSWRAKHSG